MNFKKSKKILALTLAVSMTITAIPNVYAVEEDTAKITQEAIEEVTGTMDVVADTFQTDDYVAVADLEETIVQIPQNGEDAIELEAAYREDESFSLNLPEEAQGAEAEISDNGTVVYKNEESSAQIGVQAISDDAGFEGVRSLITINDATASKEYAFGFKLEAGTRLELAKDFLGEEFDTGEAYIVDSGNEIIGIIDAAWAYDANGNEVPTYYKVKGNELIQVVEFTEDTIFPIVADPSLWKIAKCIGAIALLIVGTSIAASTLIKIKNYIKALGGLKMTVKLVLGATSAKEKAKYSLYAIAAIGAILFDIDRIHKNCY